MEKLISCCGLNCATCDARIATLENNDELRKSTAAAWGKMFNAPEIDYTTINCTGCRMDGVKFSHCETCEIRVCAHSKGFATCGECSDMETCQIVAMVHAHAPNAVQNLKGLN
jgi:hypothetical protein